MYTRKAGIIVAGAAIGGSQTFLLREFVDRTQGAIIPGIGSWGNPSVIAGLAGGGIATALGILGSMGKGPITGDEKTSGLLAYGIPALVGGIYSGMYPVTGFAGLAARSTRMIKPSSTTVRPSLNIASPSTSSSSSEILA